MSRIHSNINTKKRGNTSLVSNTVTKKQKKQQPYFKHSRSELSGMVQFLIDFAGTDSVIEAVCDNHSSSKINFLYGKVCKNKTKTLWYKSSDRTMGHWVYIDRLGIEYNSYTLGHQKSGSHQFCQTFALIYMLKDMGVTEWFDRLISINSIDKNTTCTNASCNNINDISDISDVSDISKFIESSDDYFDDSFHTDGECGNIDDILQGNIFGHNICVAVSFWEYFITSNKELAMWCIEEFKSINDEIIEYNSTVRRESAKNIPITESSDDITIELLIDKLHVVKINSFEIAMNT